LTPVVSGLFRLTAQALAATCRKTRRLSSRRNHRRPWYNWIATRPVSCSERRNAMNHDAMQELLRRQPFEPFEIRLTNGEKCEIRHPEMALLLKSRLVVALPDDRMVICPLLHIASVETLQSA
jgi:hypothetical protein